MQSIHILQLLPMYHPKGEEILNENAKVTKFETFDEEEVTSYLSTNKVDGIMLRAPSKITAKILDACQQVKAISGAGVGLDNIDVDYATKKGISVLHAPKINTTATAEHTVSLILSVMKKVVEFNEKLKEGDFSYRDGKFTRELKGKTLGLVGFGSISQEVAHIMKNGFGMNVLAYVRRIPEERQQAAGKLGVKLTKDMEEVFKTGDVISLHIPLTTETDEIVNKKYFTAMKPEAVLINTARGGIINENDLVEAVQNRTISAAGIDVFRNEPPPSNHPFFEVDNIVKTPHIGGISLEAAKETSETIATNLIKAIQGEEVSTIVNKNR